MRPARGPGGERDNTARSPRGWTALLAGTGLGVAMVIVPAVSLPGHAQVLTVAGLMLVAANLASPITGWRGPATLAAVTAVAAAALGKPGTATLAVEGLLILGYLLLADAPDAMPWRIAVRWLRLQVPAAAWAVLAMAAILLMLDVPVPVSAWLVVAGAGAAVAATLLALPRRPREPGEPR